MSEQSRVAATAVGPIAEPARDLNGKRSVLESDDGRSIGALLSDVTSNVSTLMQQELALAKAELRQTGTRAGKGAGLFAGAAAAALLFLVFLSVSAWWGLGQFIGNQWSGLIVAVVWAIVAGILALVGKKELERIRGLAQTAETLSKVPNAVKGHEEENR
ncbi:MAG TPA: phage holin family protein [Microlunatus sp.]|nr:phage holin family protein [Microlunatus sp.]